MAWRIGLLFVGAILLLAASGAIIAGAFRSSATPTMTTAATIPVITVTPPVTAVRPSATASGITPTHPSATVAIATRAVATPGSQATASRSPIATPALPTVINGGCAMSLPAGYAADPTQVGYYPARDQTGFVALDAFTGANQSPASIALAFVNGTLSRVLTDYQQTGATDLGDRYRIDYRATSNGKAGRGSTQVQVFAGVGCGVTVFALDSATGPLAATFDLLVRSLMPVTAPRTGTATTTP